MHCVVAMAWGLGGHLPDAMRLGLSKVLVRELCNNCKQLESLPASVSLYDITPDASTLDFKAFDTIVPQYEFESGVEFNSIFVPTAGTVARTLLLDSMVGVSRRRIQE